MVKWLVRLDVVVSVQSWIAIAAHFRYISKNGRLEIENEHRETMRGKDTLHELADEWRLTAQSCGRERRALDGTPGSRCAFR